MINKICTTKEGCYFLGFIWGDGFVKDTMIQVSIVEKDGNNLRELFKSLFGELLIEKKINIYDNPSNIK